MGNFGGGGGQDLLWEHTNGLLAVWFMQGTNHVGTGSLESEPGEPDVARGGDGGLWRSDA